MSHIIIMIVYSFILSYNNIQFDTSSSNINMDLNEVISGNLDYSLTLQGEEYDSLVTVKYMYGYGESDGIAFLKSDNSLWVVGRDTRNISVKTAENVNSVKSFSQLQYAAILKNDNSVWVATAHSSDGIYFFEEIFKDAMMIDIKKGGDTLYILKKDNSLWSYKSENDKLSKIIDDVLYVRSSTLSSKEDYNLEHYVAIIKTDNSLWVGKDDNLNDLKKISDNIIAVDVHNNEIVSVNTNNDLISSDCSTGNVSSIKLADNVKYAKFNNISEIYILKTDNSLWIKNIFENTPKKLLDNIIKILGDSNLFFMDKDQNLIEISDTEEVCTEYIDLNSR